MINPVQNQTVKAVLFNAASAAVMAAVHYLITPLDSGHCILFYMMMNQFKHLFNLQ